MDQAERETLQDAERAAEQTLIIAEMTLSLLESTIKSLEEDIKKVSKDLSELRNTEGRRYLLNEDMQKIQDSINEFEKEIRWMDKEQVKFEKDLQSCKPWEFSKKNQLKKEIEYLERYKASSREDIEPLQQKLKEKENEYRQECLKERNLEAKKQNLEQKLSEKKDEHWKEYLKSGHKVEEIRRRRNMENLSLPSCNLSRISTVVDDNVGYDMMEAMQRAVKRGRGRIRK